MHTDIFSSFDPATSGMNSSFFPALFWALALLPLIVKSDLWLSQSQKSWSIFSTTNTMVEQSARTSALHLKSSTSILAPLFLTLILINLLGLLPYSFSFSSHILFSFAFGLPIWTMIVLSASTYNPSSFAAHLLPAGAPMWLNPALVLIETVSLLVRPLTLSFRLAANMSAGHIMLTLASTFLMSSVISSSPSSSLILLLVCSFYSIFEMAICAIQAYIFCLLLSLYTDDHPL